jgi:hypothetical protein
MPTPGSASGAVPRPVHMNDVTIVFWQGISAEGNPRAGHSMLAPATLLGARAKQRWRMLRVFSDRACTDLVGQLEPDGSWWTQHEMPVSPVEQPSLFDEPTTAGTDSPLRPRRSRLPRGFGDGRVGR